MPPRKEPRHPAEPSFPDIAQLWEAIVNAIWSSFRPPQMTLLETVYNLKLNHFIGNERHEGAEKWLSHVKKTFLVMQSQGNLPSDRWVETTTWFLGRSLHPGRDRSHIICHQRRFTDLSRYDPEVAANPVEMFHRFRLENMPNESDDEKEKNGNQRQDDKGKGQSSQEPRKSQSLKRSGVSSSFSSGGLSSNMLRRDGRFSEGPRFQKQRDYGGLGAPLCRRCNNRHFGKCRRGSSACYTCGQMGHRAAHCLQNQQRPQQPSLPSPALTQQTSGSSGYGQTGRDGAYHYQGDAAPYTSEQYQYSQDPHYQGGYPQY
ncbi:unnamed protein product [Malus baccata var. baccata]